MSQVICLLVGMILGGLIGVAAMSLVQINCNYRTRKDKFENAKEKPSKDG